METNSQEKSTREQSIDWAIFMAEAADLTTNCLKSELKLCKTYFNRIKELNKENLDDSKDLITGETPEEDVMTKAQNQIQQIRSTIQILENELSNSEIALFKLTHGE